MKCIAIDDEPFALDLVKNYIDKTPFLECQATFSNPLKAMAFLIEQKADLIFLDINMPELSGIQFLKSLNYKPLVIFTTAYPEFGAESYEYDAIDYLLKPIKYERFLRAVGKVFDLDRGIHFRQNESNEVRSKHETIIIHSGSQIHRVPSEEIYFIEGSGNYVVYQTANKKIMALQTMKNTIKQLPNEFFIRIHKSYLVSLRHIDVVERHRIIVKGHKIPIGATYREYFLSKYKKPE